MVRFLRLPFPPCLVNQRFTSQSATLARGKPAPVRALVLKPSSVVPQRGFRPFQALLCARRVCCTRPRSAQDPSPAQTASARQVSAGFASLQPSYLTFFWCGQATPEQMDRRARSAPSIHSRARSEAPVARYHSPSLQLVHPLSFTLSPSCSQLCPGNSTSAAGSTGVTACKSCDSASLRR
jgi:hypothetical protein